MKLLLPWVFVCVYALYTSDATAQFSNPALPSVNVPNAKIMDVISAMRDNLTLADSGEGSLRSRINTFEGIWGYRAFRTDSLQNALSGTNLYSQYGYGIKRDLQMKQAHGCGSQGFQGSWQCFGPSSLPTQRIGYVTTVWADDVDTNYILAGTPGGLFRTENGGDTWRCITDEVNLSLGVIDVTCIAVNPINKNTIYLGTYNMLHDNWLRENEYHGLGVGMLKSFDGGHSWQQEVIQFGSSLGYGDSITGIQRIFFTPDTTRLYAFSGKKVFTRLNDNVDVWTDITPPDTLLDDAYYKSLQFVPGDQNHFFVSSTYMGASIFESTIPVPSSVDWINITLNLHDTFAGGVIIDDSKVFGADISMPDSDSLYAIICTYENAPVGLEVYTPSTGQWHRLNNNLPNTFSQPSHFVLRVSKALTTNNSNKRNIYYGNGYPYQSVDGGLTFQLIGDGLNTHTDIRDIYMQKSTNSLHGVGDMLIVATDGGVSRKPSGYVVDSLAQHTTINIDGDGLTCGEFWSVATSEERGLALGGMHHNGVVSYQPDGNPQWVTMVGGDCYTSMIDNADRTIGYNKFFNANLLRTVAGGGREMESMTSIDTDFPNEVSVFNSPLAADEVNNQYSGNIDLWRRVNGDFQFHPYASTLGLLSTKRISKIASDPYDNSNGFKGYVLYTINSDTTQQIYYRDPNSGPDFQLIGTEVPFTPAYPAYCITLDPQAAERVFVGIGGINWLPDVPTKNRVQYSPDWGTTWIDISNGLPQHSPVSNITFQEGANRLFASTDVGIYTCNMNEYLPSHDTAYGANYYYNNSPHWECFSSGKYDSTDFPNSYVTELKINYCEAKLYASTYGRSIWRTDLYPDNLTIPPGTTNHITTNTTWDSQKYITGNVLVDSNVTLTITDPGTVIHMPRNGKITLERGAKLILKDSARITNSCDNCFWWGIVAKGTKDVAQNHAWLSNPKHAVVRMTNGAVLENALRAVTLFDFFGGDGSKTGGIIEAHNSSFLNNRNSLFAIDYKDFDNKSGFYNCTFSVDSDYKGHDADYPFGVHAVIVDVKGIDFKGCRFENTDTAAQNRGKGTGILACNTGFSVLPTCSGYPCTYQRSVFEGFRNGITIVGSYDDPTTAYISHADFDRNTVGVRVVEKNDVTVINSSFSMGYGLPSNYSEDQYVVFLPDCPWNIGIYTNGATRFTVAENSFTGHGVAAIGEIGVVTTASGVNDNTIYKCTFDSLDHACVASRVNGHSGGWFDPDDMFGLRYRCNAFSNNGEDIHIGANPNYVLGQQAPCVDGIAPHQGIWDGGTSTFISAGNTFSGSGANILNEGHPISYYCGGGSSIPGTTLGEVTVSSSSPSASCPSKYNPDAEWETDVTSYAQSMPDIKAGWNDLSTARTTAIGTLMGQIDGGSTGSLVSYISGLTPTPANAASLKSTLLGYSPYLSSEAIIASFSIITNNSDREDVVLANPDILKNDAYYYYLANSVFPAFPGAVMTAFASARNTVSARGEAEMKIAMMTSEMSELAEQVIVYYKMDTTGTEIDSLPVWYRNYHSIDGEYSMVGHYFSLGDTTRAQELLDSIPVYYSFNDSQQRYYDEYSDIFAISKGVIADGRAMTAPDSSEISAVNAVIGSGMHEIGVFAQRLFGPDVRLDPPTGLAILSCFDAGWIKERKAQPGSGQPLPPLTSLAENSRYLVVSPNPARDNVLFKYDVPDANGTLEITVSNSVGQMVKRFAPEGNKGSINWDTERVQAGAYIYKLADSKGVMVTGKLVIVK